MTTQVIREAAQVEFSARGLDAPLEAIALAAGVSKGTIYNRFGGRQGLVDAVVEDLVRVKIEQIVAAARAVTDPGERLAAFLRETWRLQFSDPVANDVLTRDHSTSAVIAALCALCSTAGNEFLAQARQERAVNPAVSENDLWMLIRANGAVVRAEGVADRDEHERLCGLLLTGLFTDPR
ncbi:TetR/AcrR family transcriptional regulator [Actinoplanes couchii]|nr:TetR/AcrR family transcriptional regulator [Actinoplanes couchii]MDR6318346.1 AcrR family transcriptional regulator [Actinoplanes couchii]